MPDFEEGLYFVDVHMYILALSRDGAVAEEITQETFFRALSTIGMFRGDCQLRVWLCHRSPGTCTRTSADAPAGRRKCGSVWGRTPSCPTAGRHGSGSGSAAGKSHGKS